MHVPSVSSEVDELHLQVSTGVYPVHLVHHVRCSVQVATHMGHRGGHESSQVPVPMCGNDRGGVVTKPHRGVGALFRQGGETTENLQVFL